MLYEPTNLIPSNLTQTGTVAAGTDDVNIQWQVNGNSAMTMFQIDVMQDNADSALVYSTGVVTENPTVAQGYSLPFYGKDRFGSYVRFVYQPNETWSTWSDNAISDGNNYKFRITQFYQETGEAVKVQLTSNLTAGTKYYIYYTGHYPYVYIYFTVANAEIFTSGNTIYFNYSHGIGWLLTSGSNARVITDISFGVANEQPDDATRINGATSVSAGDIFYNQFFTTQNAASAFITRAEPVLIVSPLTTTPVASATQNFTATYSQAQGDSINTVRWQLFNSTDMVTPIDDTGDVSTSVLSYEYNGLFDGQSYSVVCTVTTESGISISSSLSFDVQYTQNEYEGDFTARILCHEDANLLTWDGIESIPGIDSPIGSADIENGMLILPENSTVTWSDKSDNNGEFHQLNFSSPWTALWRGKLSRNKEIAPFSYDILVNKQAFDAIVRNIAFSPDGKLMVAVGSFNNHVALYSVNGAFVEFLQYIKGRDGSDITSGQAFCAAFSPDGMNLFIGGTFPDSPAIYSVSGQNVSFKEELELPTSEQTISSQIRCAAFSHSGDLLVLGTYSIYQDMGVLLAYTISSSGEYTLQPIIEGELGWRFSDVKFNPTGTILVACGDYNDTVSLPAIIFSINGTTITRTNTLKKNGSDLQKVYSVDFSPNGGSLIACGDFSGKAYIFNVNGTNITYSNDLLGEDGGALQDAVVSVSYSNDGSYVLLGGYKNDNFHGGACLYSVGESGALTFLSSVPQSGELNGYISCVKFFQTSNNFILAGQFTGFASVYTVANTCIFSISEGGLNCYADNSYVTVKDAGGIIGRLPYSSEWGDNFECLILVSSNLFQLYGFNSDTYIGMQGITLSYQQGAITSVSLIGAQECDYFSIIDGNGDNIQTYLKNPMWEPEWNNSEQYIVDLLANFLYGLDGGIANDSGDGFRIYRRTASGAGYHELVTLPSSTTALRDYGIKSNESYIYDFYVYDANGAFMGVRSTEATPLKRQFKRFSLLSTQYNESDKCYHVLKEYQFSCNIQDMTVSNNSNKSYVQNFTPYPTVFQSTANYASGTLQALIGFVDPKAYKYWDSTHLMDELNALSTTTDTLFLKDMKGHLWMVDVGTVQMTATQKTREMQVTISLPWTEIGDASDVSIIQTPDDEGWGIDAQVLDVKLNVDMETGLLYAVYPTPYSGTAFYLVGVTPDGVISAVQPLPSTASQPTDGQLKAVVRHK